MKDLERNLKASVQLQLADFSNFDPFPFVSLVVLWYNSSQTAHSHIVLLVHFMHQCSVQNGHAHCLSYSIE